MGKDCIWQKFSGVGYINRGFVMKEKMIDKFWHIFRAVERNRPCSMVGKAEKEAEGVREKSEKTEKNK